MQIIRVKAINAPGRALGCEKAPAEILRVLSDIASNEKGKLIDKKLFNLEEIHVNNSDVEESQELIYKNAKKIFSEQDKAFFIGGDHSISYPLMKAFSEVFRNSFLIVFDAHVDCIAGGKGTSGKEPTHEEWLRKLVEEGFPPENIILISARNIWPEEFVFIKGKKIRIITMQQIQEDRRGVCDGIMEKARGADGLYISIDIDSIDPGFAPATGYLEPGGMTSRELIYFLHRLTLLKSFKAADIVEINPDKDINEMTIKLGAKLLAEMI